MNGTVSISIWNDVLLASTRFSDRRSTNASKKRRSPEQVPLFVLAVLQFWILFVVSLFSCFFSLFARQLNCIANNVTPTSAKLAPSEDASPVSSLVAVPWTHLTPRTLPSGLQSHVACEPTHCWSQSFLDSVVHPPKLPTVAGVLGHVFAYTAPCKLQKHCAPVATVHCLPPAATYGSQIVAMLHCIDASCCDVVNCGSVDCVGCTNGPLDCVGPIGGCGVC